MKTIVAGSRDITSLDLITTAIEAAPWKITELVSGAARGVDQLGETYAAAAGIQITKFPADWKKYGRGAGPVRNREMGNYADALIAIWDGKSKGTKSMIDIATANNLKVFVFRTDSH